MALFRRRPKGIEFTVRIEDEDLRREVGDELEALDIPFDETDDGLVIEARGETAPEDVRKILRDHGLRGPATGSSAVEAATDADSESEIDADAHVEGGEDGEDGEDGEQGSVPEDDGGDPDEPD